MNPISLPRNFPRPEANNLAAINRITKMQSIIPSIHVRTRLSLHPNPHACVHFLRCLAGPHALSGTSYLQGTVSSLLYPDTPGVPSTDEHRYRAEGFNPPQTCMASWDADQPWREETSTADFNFHIGFPSENVTAEVPYEGAPVVPSSMAPDQLLNTAMNKGSLAPPMTTTVEPNLTSASITTLRSHASPTPPGHKHQCFACLRTFDRESRLENCLNRHFSVRPHGCFGACWMVRPFNLREFKVLKQSLHTQPSELCVH